MGKDFKRCRQCKHFTQHYNINEERIYKLECGHCKAHAGGKSYKIYNGRSECPLFEQVEKFEKEKIAINKLACILKSVYFNLEYIKHFLNKDLDGQKVDKLLLDELNKR